MPSIMQETTVVMENMYRRNTRIIKKKILY